MWMGMLLELLRVLSLLLWMGVILMGILKILGMLLIVLGVCLIVAQPRICLWLVLLWHSLYILMLSIIHGEWLLVGLLLELLGRWPCDRHPRVS